MSNCSLIQAYAVFRAKQSEIENMSVSQTFPSFFVFILFYRSSSSAEDRPMAMTKADIPIRSGGVSLEWFGPK